MKRYIALLTAASFALLCACSDKGSAPASESDTIREIMSEAGEINETKDDTYAALPDTVELDDTDHVSVLEPDKNGNISYERLGVSFHLPDGYTAYLFERDRKEGVDEDEEEDYDRESTEDYNPTCEASIFLIGPNFPYSSEYIRLTYFTSLMLLVDDYDTVMKYKKFYGAKIDDYAAYIDALKKDIDHYKSYIKFNEGLDVYNYADIDYTEVDNVFMFMDEDFMNESYIGVLKDDMVVFVNRATAPDSELGTMTIEDTELENGTFGVRLDYDMKRNGIPMEKEVYWLYKEGNRCFGRVEFSKDKGAKMTADEQAFLESYTMTDPVCKNPDALIDYFDHMPRESEEETN